MERPKSSRRWKEKERALNRFICFLKTFEIRYIQVNSLVTAEDPLSFCSYAFLTLNNINFYY